MRTSIIGRPRPSSRQRRADHLYTLDCEEPGYFDTHIAPQADFYSTLVDVHLMNAGPAVVLSITTVPTRSTGATPSPRTIQLWTVTPGAQTMAALPSPPTDTGTRTAANSADEVYLYGGPHANTVSAYNFETGTRTAQHHLDAGAGTIVTFLGAPGTY